MRRIWLVVGVIVFLLSLTVTPALAQMATKPTIPPKGDAGKGNEAKAVKPGSKVPPTVPPAARLPFDVEKPAEEPKKELKPVTGEKVVVQLREGDVIRGVVKGARTELLKDGRYLAAKDREAPGAGVRVWYAMGLNGFVFVPYPTIDAIEFQGPLPEEEGLEIARWIASEKRGRDQARRRQASRASEEKKGVGEGESEAGEDAGKPKPAAAKPAAPARPVRNSARVAKVGELMKRFPPEVWKPSRLAEIKDRQLILNIKPTEEERAFMKSYDAWLEGYELWRKQSGAGGS